MSNRKYQTIVLFAFLLAFKSRKKMEHTYYVQIFLMFNDVVVRKHAWMWAPTKKTAERWLDCARACVRVGEKRKQVWWHQKKQNILINFSKSTYTFNRTLNDTSRKITSNYFVKNRKMENVNCFPIWMAYICCLFIDLI